MINSVTVTNHLGDSVTMELRFPEKSGFLIHNIDGLGPPKANINTIEPSGMDGVVYNSAVSDKRNIVFTLGFLEWTTDPNEDTTFKYSSVGTVVKEPVKVYGKTIEDIRHDSYRYFPLKKRVELQINTDDRICKTYGYVESNEPNIFSEREGCIISIICPDAFVYSEHDQNTVFSSIEAAFEFPFSNESLTEKLLEFGVMTIETTKTIYYEGDAEVGIVIYIHADGNATNIRIINADTLEELLIDTDALAPLIGGSGLIEAGDEIIISTVKGNRYAHYISHTTGLPINVFNALGQYPHWFTLEKGDNVIAYTAESGLSNLQFRIENRIAFEGV